MSCTPTPLNPDDGIYPAPLFSVPQGSYTTNITVSIITKVPAGAKIYYTVDGTVPTADSIEYTAPISIIQTTTITAVAIKDGQRSQRAMAIYKYLQWQQMDDPNGFTGYTGAMFMSLDFDYRGYPVIAYRRSNPTINRYNLDRYNWSEYTADGPTSTVGSNIIVKMVSNLYFVAYHSVNLKSIRVMFYTNGSGTWYWSNFFTNATVNGAVNVSNAISTTTTGSVGTTCGAIGFDFSKYATVAYYDTITGNMTVRQRSGVDWSDLDVPFAMMMPNSIDLQYDSGVNQYYLGCNLSNGIVRVYKNTAGWVLLGGADIDTGGSGVAIESSRSPANPYVAYLSTNTTNVYVKYWNGATWATLGTNSIGKATYISNYVTNAPAICMRGTDVVVAYATTNGVAVRQCVNGTTWTDLGGAVVDTIQGLYPAIKVSPINGDIFLTFKNVSTGRPVIYRYGP
ncbi:MAG: chitobiase/beta-hexosaminidase C-terminal domain-containing protein [Spirochaetes bacterium]|nr:chitobiase/beta-hexosaminidase C-terminal domain-containing protein [Spirochaetota bacterium]